MNLSKPFCLKDDGKELMLTARTQNTTDIKGFFLYTVVYSYCLKMTAS